jgi:hypothetical protein
MTQTFTTLMAETAHAELKTALFEQVVTHIQVTSDFSVHWLQEKLKP